MLGSLALFAYLNHLQGAPAVASQVNMKPVNLGQGISVLVPSAAQPEPSPKKNDPNTKTWVFDTGGATYLILVMPDYHKVDPKATADQELAGMVAGLLEGYDHPIVKYQRDVVLNGWPGLEAVLDCPVKGEGHLAQRMRAVCVGETIVVMVAQYASESGQPGGAAPFLNSISLAPDVKPGPMKAPGPVFEAFIPPSSGCSISMPGKAAPYTEPNPDGSKPGFTRFVAHYGNRLYFISYAPLPKEAPPNGAEAYVVDRIVQAFEGKVTKGATVYTRDGIDLTTAGFSFPEGGIGRVDVAVEREMIYGIVMLYPPGHEGSPDIKEFFDSFKLLPKEAKKS